MKRAIVFGAGGQLGMAVILELLRFGWSVTAVARFRQAMVRAAFGEALEVIDQGEQTREQLLTALRQTFDAVFDPTGYTANDARDLLAARSRFGSIVTVSSCSVYADAEGRSLDEAAQTGFPEFDAPMTENTTTVPAGEETYSTRKVAMENLFRNSSAVLSCGILHRFYQRAPIWSRTEPMRPADLTRNGLLQSRILSGARRHAKFRLSTGGTKMAITKKVYTAHGTAIGGRGAGTASTDDKMIQVVLAHPKEMGGDGKGTNPEQLFAVGYASCFLGAMKFANSKEKKPLSISPDSSVTAHVTFGPRKDKKGFGIEVKLDVKLPGIPKAKAAALAKKGHVVCPYSDAIKKGVKVTTKIV